MKNQFKDKIDYKGYTITSNLNRPYSIDGTKKKSWSVDNLKLWIDSEIEKARVRELNSKVDQGELF
jgi:hypothetical protein